MKEGAAANSWGGRSRAAYAEMLVAEMFEEAGYHVNRRPAPGSEPPHRLGSQGSYRPDMVVRRGRIAYVVEVKAGAEGRGDRLVPLWSQACLQALRAAGDRHPPLAVVAAPRIAPQVAEQILEFAARFAPDCAAGVVDFEGFRLFRGPELDRLSVEVEASPPNSPASLSRPSDLFSDLNQWMLKVLLAPELPEHLLSAPRGSYSNASQLARAANVSVMSAFRFVQQLGSEGHLHESKRKMELVRREHLFRRWQAAGLKPAHELRMRYLLRGDPAESLRRVLREGDVCLGLFAAASALKHGFVSGVPPYVYVRRLPQQRAAWRNLVPIDAGEPPDLVLRQARAPQSLFRALVSVDDLPVSDILQVWLDVEGHPARGQEQADLIHRQIIGPLLRSGPDHG